MADTSTEEAVVEEEEEFELPPEPKAEDLPQAQFQQGEPGKPGARPSGKKKERLPVIHESDWVTLSREETDNVPEHLVGHYAAVLSAPFTWVPDPDSGRGYEEQEEDVELTVRTRDEFDAILIVTREDVAEVHPNGKPGR